MYKSGITVFGTSRLMMLFGFMLILGQSAPAQKLGSSTAWEKISVYFSPPDSLKDQYGEYSSPLQFYNGEKVKTRQDWETRRQEILHKWHGMMGEWPPIMEYQKMEFLSSTKRENFTQHQIRFEWVPGQSTTGYLLVPEGEGPFPAVITVFYEPETAIGLSDKPNRDFAYQLVKRGFVTLSLGTTESTNNQTYSIYYPSIDQATVEPLSMLAYAAANAWHVLANIPEVDETRIGIVGHSYGGKWAMFASALYDRFACAAWSDPGIVFEQDRPSINYWEPWYLGYHPRPWRKRGLPTADNPMRGLYPMLLEKGHDLHELHALMAPRPFLVSGGSEDPLERWIPLNHSIAVNRLLGYSHRVGMTNRPDHSPSGESNEVIYLFFQHFLQEQRVQK
ncbi:MAG TPA: acetylxylan esterase [Cyclobacteriaceae bacterium]|nr:acetylxylan esterase [Cyclobacteriaceae bacterium]